MKAWILFVSILVALLVAGCGGSGGGGGSQVAFVTGPFSGTWTSTDSQNGTSAITVDADGSFSGTFYNQTHDLNGTIEGQIVSDGSFQGTITIGGSDYAGNGEFDLSQDQNNMTGHMNYQSVTFNFNFTRTPM